MTQPTTATDLPVSICTGAILASDFSSNTTDQTRRQWTGGKMRHLVQALGDIPVAIILDGSTGHGLAGVRLHLDIMPDQRVMTESLLSDGTIQKIAYRLYKLGETIIPLPQHGTYEKVKWDALASYHAEQQAAISAARALHGEREGRAWGKWEATPTGGAYTIVTYTPVTTNDAQRDRWGTYWFGRVKDGVVYAS